MKTESKTRGLCSGEDDVISEEVERRQKKRHGSSSSSQDSSGSASGNSSGDSSGGESLSKEEGEEAAGASEEPSLSSSYSRVLIQSLAQDKMKANAPPRKPFEFELLPSLHFRRSRSKTTSPILEGGSALSLIKITSAVAPFSPSYNFSKSLVQETTTEGPAVIGSASRNLGGRDEIRSQSSTSERWIPPSAIRRDALPENSDDVKFRKVRGILNKLTPQTFDRLTEELIRIGLDSQVLLKGVILLIFEKALQEPKYVSMYAQLCKKLSKKVPNFDPPNPDNTTTFRRLLLNKCQDEYANRAHASAMYDKRTGLSPEEEEEKLLAKRKMLGNIKFIGELGKLEMLTHSILHKCCEELVKKTKAEDLECLCQIMSTCGHLLDNDKGKYLMDQYFDRMKELSENDKLPARIRFMLQDVIELRDNHWLPRKTVSLKESPKPIQEIRREAHDELGISDGNRSPTEEFRYLQIDPRRNGRIFQKKRTGLEDVFAPVPLAMTSLGTGPGVITPGEKGLGGMETNGFHTPPPIHNNYRPAGGMRGYNNAPNQPNNMPQNNHPYYHQQHKNNIKYHHNQNNMHHHNHMNHNNHHGGGQGVPGQGNQVNMHHDGQMNMHHNMRNNQNNMNNHGYEKSPVAPRFMKQQQANNPAAIGTGAPPIQMSAMPMQNEELSFRPPPTSMIKMIPQPMKPPTFAPPSIMDPRKSPVTAVMPPPVVNQPPPPVDNPLMLPGNKGSMERKKKAPSKDDIIKKVDDVIRDFCTSKSNEGALEAMKALSIPEKHFCDVMVAVLNKAMDHNEADRESIYSLVIFLVEQEFITMDQFREAFRTMLDLMADLEADIPRIKSYVAAFAGRAITQNRMSIAEVAELTENGRHYPFLLLVLQHMSKTLERTKLCKLFEESKVSLLTTLPKTDRTKDRMAEILEERELSFLFPLLKIQSEMAKRLQINADPNDFLEWVKGQVDVTYQTSQGFIHALMTVLFKFISNDALKALGLEGDASQANEKQIKEKEKELLLKYKPVISTFLADRVDLQVIGIYALQSAWFTLECPKVMLLRWFMNTYELDLIEEDAFLKWKEDIRDDYPGKGNALFQVNQWLNWLEEEEDDGEDGDDAD